MADLSMEHDLPHKGGAYGRAIARCENNTLLPMMAQLIEKVRVVPSGEVSGHDLDCGGMASP